MSPLKVRKAQDQSLFELENLEDRLNLAAGVDVALYEFTTHDPNNGVFHLFSSDTHAETTAGDVSSALYLGFTGNGEPPRGLALGGAFNETTEPTPAGGQNDYFEFTITPDAGYDMSLARFSMQVRKNDPTSKDSYSVYFDNDPGPGGNNYSTKLLGATIFSEDTFETLDVDLEGIAELTNQNTPVTFRVYSWGTAGLGTARLDNVRVQAVQSTVSSSKYAYYGDSGRLVTPQDEQGNRVADFSTAGYRNGNEPIPDVTQTIAPSRVVNVSPIAGDDMANIQAAIDQVEAMSLDANGFRGIVQLGAGEFQISDRVQILESGVVLRGAGDGDNPAVDTILRGTGTTQRPIVVVGPSAGFASGTGGTVNIVDKYVPVGATSVNVDATTGFTVGDPIILRRPSTAEWITAIGMDMIPPRFDGGTVNQWTPGGNFDQSYERKITRIEGNRIFFDAPLTNSFEQQYGGGTVFRYTFPRINRVGIENIRGKSDFTGPTDEAHASTFIELQAVEDAWVTNVTGQHFVYATVHATSRAIRVTVDDAQSLDPVSIITGARRYPFTTDGQFVLMKNLYSEEGRHDFVNNSSWRNRGPNVFLNGTAVNSHSSTGPHQRWSTGTLYDTITTDNLIEARNRGNFGSGHGWGGANFVFWNTVADTNIVQNPQTAHNWLIGATGSIIEETRFGPQPSGNYDAIGTPIDFGDANNPTSSLFVAQYNQRKAIGTGTPELEQREYVLGDYDLVEYDGGSSADNVNVDSAWQSAISALAGAAPIADSDISTAGQHVPFSFQYALAAGEAVYAATLTLGLRSTSGNVADDALLFDSVTDSRTFASLGIAGELTLSETTPVTIEIYGSDLLALQDGVLNLAINDDTVLDWASLDLQVAFNNAPNLASDATTLSGDVLDTLTNTGTFADVEGHDVTLTASLGDVIANANGTWSWTLDTTERYANETVTITGTDELGFESVQTFQINAATNAVTRGVVYGGTTAAYGEAAMATNVTALLPGETATAQNYTNYHRGLNRVAIDVAGLASTALTASDFEFRIGNTADVGEWMLLDGSPSNPLPTISVSATATPGVDRVMLAWDDNVIDNTWLQVNIKATPVTGLDADETFYLGNQVGDVNGDVNTATNRVRVNSFDTGLVRLNQSPVNTVGIESVYDIDRNGLVNSFDTGRVRLNQSLGGLLLFTAPLNSPPSEPLVTALPATITSFTITPETVTNYQRGFVDRLLTRYEQGFKATHSVERRRELTIRRLNRVATRLAESADSAAFRQNLVRQQNRTQLALVLKTIADQLQAQTELQTSEIVAPWR